MSWFIKALKEITPNPQNIKIGDVLTIKEDCIRYGDKKFLKGQKFKVSLIMRDTGLIRCDIIGNNQHWNCCWDGQHYRADDEALPYKPILYWADEK